MSRDDLVLINTKIVRDVAEQIRIHAPKAFVLVITNPVDAMVYVMKKVTGFPKNRVIGMAGVLDAARFRAFISLETGISVEDITAFVLGGHGDTMVPLARYSTIAGIPLTEYPGLTYERITAIEQRTREGGGEIVNLLKTGSAFYAPAASAISMAEAIIKDQRRIFAVAALCEGEYGQHGIYMGVPVILGEHGIKKIVEIKLTPQEQAELDNSALHVKQLMDVVDKSGIL
jgi:malate dehydrogenase